MARSNDVVLSYHDCVLRQSDMSLLNGSCWLNDAIIGFYFEFLGQKYQSPSPKFLFVSPELTQLLKLTSPHEYPIFLDPIDAKSKDFIFFPVNDCNSRSMSGGSHWSLMVYSRRDRTCFYYDSSSGMNTSVARDFSRDIMSYLVEKLNTHFVEMTCPQQENGYDCGLFVLCFADVIAEHAMETHQVTGTHFAHVKNLVANKRQSLIALIKELKCQKQ